MLFLFLLLLRWKRMPDIVECDFITSFIIPSVQSDVEAVSWHVIHSPPASSSATPTVLEAAQRLAGCLYCNSSRVFPFLSSGCSHTAHLIQGAG